MAATAKTAYTAEQTAELLSVYDPAAEKDVRDAVVQDMAEKFGKSVKSVIAKLSREGVYKKAERVRKDGTAVVKKEDLATKIGELVGLSEGEADSLAKATRSGLVKILDALQE